MSSAPLERDGKPWRLAPAPGSAPHRSARNSSAPRCVIYKRRSLITDKSASLSRQGDETTGSIASIGGVHDPKTDVYIDDDISAYKRRYRPGLEALLERIETIDDIDIVVVYEVARATRNKDEFAIFAQILKAHGVELRSVREQMVSLYGIVGEVITAWIVSWAQQEAETISERLQSSHDQRARAGIWRNGRSVYGTRRMKVPSPLADRLADVTVLEPDEDPIPALVGTWDAAPPAAREIWPGPPPPAEVVRWVADERLRGRTLSAIARDLNEWGIPPPSPDGKRWYPETLQDILTTPSIAGYSTHGGQPALDANGDLVQAERRVLEPAVWRQVAGKPKDQRSKHMSSRPRRRNDEHMLTSLLKCAICGHTLRRNPSKSGKAYVCRTGLVDRRACPGNTVAEASCEDMVTEEVLAVLGNPERKAAALGTIDQEAQPKAAKIIADRRAAEDRLTRLDDNYDAGVYVGDTDVERYRQRRQAVIDELVDLQIPARRSAPRWVEELSQDDIRAAWNALSATERKTIVHRLVDHIVVAKRTSPLVVPGHVGATFDPSRFKFVWRHPAADVDVDVPNPPCSPEEPSGEVAS